MKEKHSLPVRLLHWLNIPVLSVMVWSGLLIYWANDEYFIHLGSFTFKFFPEGFYDFFNLKAGLAKGLGWHFTFMWVFATSGLLYTIHFFRSGHWREVIPTKLSDFRDAFLVTLHDLGLVKELPPQGKYNAAQKIAYSGVLALGWLVFLSGLAIYKPVQISWLTWCLGGYKSARLIHFLCMISFPLFVVVHVAQVIKAGWNEFQAMVTGFTVEPEETLPAPDLAVSAVAIEPALPAAPEPLPPTLDLSDHEPTP